MCGIVGAIADRDVVPVLIEGLKRLEYRGYDSAGIAILGDDGVRRVRRTVLSREDALDVIARRPEPIARQLVGEHPVQAVAAAEDHGAHGDRLDPEPLEVRKPAVDRRLIPQDASAEVRDRRWESLLLSVRYHFAGSHRQLVGELKGNAAT